MIHSLTHSLARSLRLHSSLGIVYYITLIVPVKFCLLRNYPEYYNIAGMYIYVCTDRHTHVYKYSVHTNIMLLEKSVENCIVY